MIIVVEEKQLMWFMVEAMGILAGDALLNFAFETVVQRPDAGCR